MAPINLESLLRLDENTNSAGKFPWKLFSCQQEENNPFDLVHILHYITYKHCEEKGNFWYKSFHDNTIISRQKFFHKFSDIIRHVKDTITDTKDYTEKLDSLEYSTQLRSYKQINQKFSLHCMENWASS